MEANTVPARRATSPSPIRNRRSQSSCQRREGLTSSAGAWLSSCGAGLVLESSLIVLLSYLFEHHNTWRGDWSSGQNFYEWGEGEHGTIGFDVI